MANRFLLKQFAEQATNTGVFGSYQDGNPTYSADPVEIQSLPAWFTGWLDATTGGTYLPRLEEMQGVQKVLCQAIIENYREGVPVWYAGETYYKNSVVSYEGNSGFALYYNLTGTYNNQSPELDTTNWANLSGLFVTKEYVDDNFLGVNRVTGGILEAQDNSTYQSYTQGYAFITYNATYDSDSGIAQGYNSDGLMLATTNMVASQNFQIDIPFQTSDVTTQQSIVAMPILPYGVGIENGHCFLGLGELHYGTITLNPNQKYYIRVIFNGSTYELQLSGDNVNFTTDITVESSEQPWAGKSIIFGNGGADYRQNYFRGQLYLGQTSFYNGGTKFFDITIAYPCNVVHFNGDYTLLAPNGRDIHNNLNNVTFNQKLNQYMLYSLVNGNKTIFVKENGEIMARQRYTRSSVAPSSPQLLDVWFDTNSNVMYDFSNQQPNFTNSGLNVDKGIVSGWAQDKAITIDASLSPEQEIVFDVTSGNASNGQRFYIWNETSCLLDVAGGFLNVYLRVASYEVAVNTGTENEPVWGETHYVPTQGTGKLAVGTDVYSDIQCSTVAGTATGLDYEYIGETAHTQIKLSLAVESNQHYTPRLSYLGGNYMLEIGTTMDEIAAEALWYPTDKLVITSEQYTGSGTVNLANIQVGDWRWNGVSSTSNTWNKIIAAPVGYIYDNGTNITGLTINKPIQLAKMTDIDDVNNNLNSRIMEVMNSVNNLQPKLNRSYRPIQPTSKVAVTGWPYTAPSDGVWIGCLQPSVSTGIMVANLNGTLCAYCFSNSNSYNQNKSSVSIPLLKGDVLNWNQGINIRHTSEFYLYR